MPSITARLSDAFERLSDHDCWNYALVPLLLAALNGRKIRAVLTSPTEIHSGLSVGIPIPATDAWSFVSAPSGGGVTVAGPGLLGVGLFALGVLLQGVVLSVYLGGLVRELRGEPARLGDAFQQYFVRFLGFTLVLLVLFLPPVLSTLAARSLASLVLLWLLVVPLGGYLLYAAPYLVVLHDCSLGEALSRSVSLALGGGPYLRYAVGYAVVVLVISIPATLVVANVPVLGILLGVVGLAPVGLVFDTATLLFVADITDAPGLGTEGGSGHGGRPHRAALSPERDSA